MSMGVNLIEGAALAALWLCGFSTGCLVTYQAMRRKRGE